MNGFEHLVDYVLGLPGAFAGSAAQAVVLASLGFMFAWSGIAKLRRPWLAAMAVVDFGVVDRPTVTLGRALGLAEAALAVALIAALWAPAFVAAAAAGAASVLLWTFVVLIARALRAGRSFACFCFGETDDLLSGRSAARTTALALIATLLAVTAAGGSAAAGSVEERILAVVAGAGVVAIAATTTGARRVWHLPSPPAYANADGAS